MRLAAILVLLSTSVAAAEPATVVSAVNLRSSAAIGAEIVGKIPAGSVVNAFRCNEWCEVEWRGKKGFAIATALDRSERSPKQSKRRDMFATEIPIKGDVPTSAGPYEAPPRYYGPFYWSYGPGSGPYRGTAGVGYRGRW